jgi:hypothetical protein
MTGLPRATSTGMQSASIARPAEPVRQPTSLHPAPLRPPPPAGASARRAGYRTRAAQRKLYRAGPKLGANLRALKVIFSQ